MHAGNHTEGERERKSYVSRYSLDCYIQVNMSSYHRLGVLNESGHSTLQTRVSRWTIGEDKDLRGRWHSSKGHLTDKHSMII